MYAPCIWHTGTYILVAVKQTKAVILGNNLPKKNPHPLILSCLSKQSIFAPCTPTTHSHPNLDPFNDNNYYFIELEGVILDYR